MSTKNSNNTIGNRTRDLPVCSAVPQPTAPPRAPKCQIFCLILTKFGLSDRFSLKILSIKSDVKPSIWSQTDTCIQTDRRMNSLNIISVGESAFMPSNVTGSKITFVGLHCKVLDMFVLFQPNLEYFDRFLWMSRISNFTEIRAVGVALKHVDGRTDRQTWVDMTKAIRGFRVNSN